MKVSCTAEWSHAAIIVAAQPVLENYSDRSCTNNIPQGDPRNDNQGGDLLQDSRLYNMQLFCINGLCLVMLFSTIKQPKVKVWK